MSASIAGAKAWEAEITIPAKFDAANGDEIGAIMGTQLAARTAFLAQHHALRQSVMAVEDAAYTTQQTINTAAWTAVAGVAFASESLTVGDIIRIETVLNYTTSGVALAEVQCVSDQEPQPFYTRRRIGLGGSLSLVHVAYHVVTETNAAHRVDTQLKIDAGTLTVEGPAHSILTVYRETS